VFNRIWYIFEKTGSFLSSRKLALFLLLLFLGMCILGTSLPQEGVEPSDKIIEWKNAHGPLVPLGLTHIFYSWYFAAIVGLACVNISFSIVQHARNTKKQILIGKRSATADYVLKQKNKVTLPLATPAEAIKRVIRGARFNSEGNIFRAERFAFARWSVVAFHLAFLLIILGVFLNRAQFYRGVYSIVENDYFVAGKEKAYFEESGFFQQQITPTRVFLKSFDDWREEPGYQAGIVSEVFAAGSTGEGHFTITRAEPLEFGGLTIYQSPNYGYAPVFTRTLRSGERMSGDIRLSEDKKAENSICAKTYKGQGFVPQSSMRIECSISAYPRAFPQKVSIRAYNSIRKVFEGEMAPGEEIRIGGDSYKLEEIKFWTDIIVSNEPWMSLMYIGSGLFFLSFLCFAVLNPCVIYGYIEPQRETITLAVKCMRYKTSEPIILEKVASRINKLNFKGGKALNSPRLVEQHGM